MAGQGTGPGRAATTGPGWGQWWLEDRSGRGRGGCYIAWLCAHPLHCMTQVTVGENEGIESALRRFKRQVSKAGIFADLKRLRHHETPTEKYKRKAQQRRRRR